MNYDDFKDAPESINEIKANKAVNSSKWTPRDALIAALRDIDQGKMNPSVIFIAVGQEDGEDTFTRFFAAGDNHYEISGVMTRAAYLFEIE